jgi:triosephosphate isomerase
MHSFIRSLVNKRYDKITGTNTPILYGGSCKPVNAKDLFSKPDIDGGLIGGASLTSDDFVSIINSF